MTRVYIGNLLLTLTRDQIWDRFGLFGMVHDVITPGCDGRTGNAGVAFVTMDDDRAAFTIRRLNGQSWCGRRLTVELAKSEQQAKA
jgi:RNA recognition motif-containing protein